MNTEDILTTLIFGFLAGLFLFAAGYMRVRRWSPRASSSGSGLDTLVAADRLADLVASVFILAMLLYGAVVAPRLRYILLVALATVGLAWWVLRAVMKWMKAG